jgi:hypothetical protein
MTTTTKSPRVGASVFNPAQPNGPTLRVIDAPQELRPSDGMFVLVSYLGYRTFGRFTGRTRQVWGMACPTIERFKVDTVADPDGSLWGEPGQSITGTMAIRPENVR